MTKDYSAQQVSDTTTKINAASTDSTLTWPTWATCYSALPYECLCNEKCYYHPFFIMKNDSREVLFFLMESCTCICVCLCLCQGWFSQEKLFKDICSIPQCLASRKWMEWAAANQFICSMYNTAVISITIHFHQIYNKSAMWAITLIFTAFKLKEVSENYFQMNPKIAIKAIPYMCFISLQLYQYIYQHSV